MTPASRLGNVEFIALMAFLFSVVALAIDTMLPALPAIAAELTPDMPNRAQLIVTSFVLGMGTGTLFTGPMADAWGRRPVIICGLIFYSLGAGMAYFEKNLGMMLFARFLMGLGAAGPRVAGMAIVRDLFAGRMMARLMSFVMIVFMLVPAVAPTVGALIITVAGWREIFGLFIVFAILAATWFALRQGETLNPAHRRPLTPGMVLSGLREISGHRNVVIFIAVLAFSFAMLFGMISTIQPIMDQSYNKAESFPLWFAFIAVVAGSSGFLNASLVLWLGMRVLVFATFGAQVIISGTAALMFWMLPLSPETGFLLFMFWGTSIFFQAGLTVGNLNALAMEPLGHLAGLAASVIGAVATVGGASLAIPLGMAFDGTPLPFAVGCFVLALCGFALMVVESKMDDYRAPTDS